VVLPEAAQARRAWAGQYTAEQISSLENKLSQYIKDYNLNSTFKVDKVK
jgi:hypothetical protein